MHRRVLGVFLAAAAAGCADSATTEPESLIAPVFSHQGAPHGAELHFKTHLTGAEENPPVATRAQGQVIFRLDRDGDELSYKLIVANIENVFMAHIHLAPPGQNGGIVVWLYEQCPVPTVTSTCQALIPGRTQGVLAEGVITVADLRGALAGGTLSDLIDEIRAGNAYVNVHTTQFPGGEIRGQL